jgi:hypothetical protein
MFYWALIAPSIWKLKILFNFLPSVFSVLLLELLLFRY